MRLQELMEADSKYSSALLFNKPKLIHRYVCIFFAHSGDSWYWLAGLLLVWFFGNDPWRGMAAFMALGLTLLAVVVLILKFTIRRPRPEGEWGQIYRVTDPHSFPSGHAARAAALAVMTLGTGPAWFAAIMVIWAPLVGFSRIRLGVHYISDVLVGTLIGILMGVISNALYPLAVSKLPFLF